VGSFFGILAMISSFFTINVLYIMCSVLCLVIVGRSLMVNTSVVESCIMQAGCMTLLALINHVTAVVRLNC